MSKKAKSINFIIPLQVYPFDVMVSVSQTDKQLTKSLDPYKKNLLESDYGLASYPSSTTEARAVLFSNKASLIRLRKLPTEAHGFGTLAHEIFHIVTFVMDLAGMKLEVMVSDEAYAYLVGYLTENIYKELNKHY